MSHRAMVPSREAVASIMEWPLKASAVTAWL